MSSETDTAAAALLHSTVKDVIRELGGTAQPAAHVHKVTEAMLAVIKKNDTLRYALLLDYVSRVIDGLPPRISTKFVPVPAKTAEPTKVAQTEGEVDLTKLFDKPKPPEIEVDTTGPKN